jgi:LmbE family N-acetylglucosaminyl deacetylase
MITNLSFSKYHGKGLQMKILVVSTHTDDAIVIAGGTILRILEANGQVFYAGLSIASESLLEGFAKDAVETETKLATKMLGIDAEKVRIERFPVRRFQEHRQKILDTLIDLRNGIKPDIVFVPSTTDTHQDHEVVNRESLRAFKNCCSIYGYDFPWTELHQMKLNLFYQLEERHIRKKMEAIKCLRSQIAKKTPYLTEEYIRGLAIERGVRIGAKYAEAFEIIREIRRTEREEVS